MKSFFIEVYSKNFPKKGFLAGTLDDVRSFLKDLIKPNYIDDILIDLERQASDPIKFPNILIFLDENNEMVHIEDFIK